MFTRVEQPAEIEAIARLAREIWTSHYTPMIGREQVDYMLERFQSVEAIQSQIDQGMRYLRIETAAGYFAYDLKPGHLFLSKIYVHPDHRKRGLARKVLEWIIKEESPACIRLTVNRHNLTSIAVYEKLGFHKTGEVVTDIGNGFVMDDIMFEFTPSHSDR